MSALSPMAGHALGAPSSLTGKHPPLLSDLLGQLLGVLAVVFVFSCVINLLMLTGPLFMLQIYDRVLASGSVPTLVALTALVACLYAVYGILDAIRGRIFGRFAAHFDRVMSPLAFDCTIRAPIKMGNDGFKVRAVQDLEHVRRFLSGPAPGGFFDLPFMPAYLALIYVFHPLLGHLALAGALILIILTVVNEWLTRAPSRRMMASQAQRQLQAETAQRHAEVLLAMGMGRAVSERFRAVSKASREASTQTGDRAAFFSSATKTLRFGLQSGILALGAYLAINQEITPGIIIAASIIMARAVAPIEILVNQWQAFVAARQAWHRVRLVFESLPGADKPDLTLDLPSKTVAVTHLSLGPPGAHKATVQDIRFQLNAGDGLGIIGPNASGKSSLVRGLVGLWDPLRGSIRLDGATHTQWHPDHLGRAIGYLPQTIDVMEGSIGEVISRFDPSATSQEIIAAAERADIHDMVTGFPDGYDTRVGEGAFALSGGQKQRLALARAVFREPFLIVLDEPNSNLDAEGEAALERAIRGLRERGSVVIVVAHRPSALGAVDLVLMMKAGRQIDFGKKANVLAAHAVKRAAPAVAKTGGLSVVKDG